MKKLILIFAVILVTATAVNAQKTMSKSPAFSIAVDGGIPVGTVSSAFFSFVIGGDIGVEYPLSSHVSLVGNVGYDDWLVKGGGHFSYVPILGGGRYYFSDKVYFSEQIGYSVGATSGLKGAFTNVGGFGIRAGQNFDILLNGKILFYSGGSFNSIGLRIAYNFGK